MKKLFLISILSIFSLVAFAQSTVNTELVLEESIFEGTEYLWIKEPLNLSNGDSEGIFLFPHFMKFGGVWVCVGLGAKNYPDEQSPCFGDDVVTVAFEDGTRMEITTWRSFECNMEYDFDLDIDMREKLSKPIKGIKYVNGRTLYTFKKMMTTTDEKNYFINVFNNLDSINIIRLTK